MRDITAQGSNVEEAIQNALATLETTRDKVEVEVLDEGKKVFSELVQDWLW